MAAEQMADLHCPVADLPTPLPQTVVPKKEAAPAPVEVDPPIMDPPQEKEKKKAPKKKAVVKNKKPPSAHPKKVAKPVQPTSLQSAPSGDEGEEMLNMGDDGDTESKEKAIAKKPHLTAAERKAAAEERRKRIRSGVGSEMSPLIRRRDGSFAFRNKELEHAQAELKKERQNAVRDSLFKFLDSPDPSSSFGSRR